ncbi:Fe-S cluster assembly protein SufD [Citricoccus sp. I39-566]|uniref:Fe-S cluster assembly protein SufD n=1 Tax=Citricoccus sp. I39-566 TaxID=3073268 RepID=UPI00286C6CB3|nr:Fe-S cluster assembly protein SufD [Citricoccus sp. I39-566]WMY77317.1 Fe-S cluster assembly protein SufD [Citricoccus sp. I39-566]
MSQTVNTTEELDAQGAGVPAIPGMGEEGETLSTTVAEASDAGHASHNVPSGAAVAGERGGAKAGSSRADRVASFELADFPALTGREEDWRFTPLNRLAGLHLPDGDESRLTGPAPAVTVSELDGVRVETVDRSDARLGSALTPDDRVSAAAWASFSQATVVTIGAGVEVGTPVRIDIAGTSEEAAAQHLLIVAEPNSRADVVLRHTGTARVAQNVEFDVQDGAGLNVTSLQAWDAGAVHVSAQQVKVGKDARIKHVAVSYGGSLVRLTPTSRLAGQGAETEMFGLYFADAGQHLEQRLFVDHAVPNAKSNVLYKGALQGQDAHTVWVGDVLIRKEAEGTDSYEKNQNLVLSEGTRVDSVPNLEIETGLIEGAGHASSTAQFDDEQLFYLMARGIEEKDARELIVRGFLNEIIQKIGIADVEETLLDQMESELQVASL